MSIRCSSQIPEDFDSSSSSLALGVFGGGRSSGTSLNRDYDHQTKRRKVSGANSRFDRMIETMSMTHRSPIKPTRHRTCSIGSFSTSYCDFPRTPVDAYDGRRAGPLGKDFTLIKMNAGHASGSAVATDGPLQDASEITSTHQNAKPLPPWLSNTLTGLDSKHPLRLLLPKSSRPPPPPGLVNYSEDINVEDEAAFAFLPAEIPPPCDGLTAGYGNLEKNNPHPSYSSTKTLPFSTPGPGSLLSESHPVSPTMHTSSHAQNANNIVSRHNSGPDADIQYLDFVPFSTPGPGSLISTGNSGPKSSHLQAIPEDPTVAIDPDFPDPVRFTTSEPTSLATTFISSLSNDPSSLRPSADLYLPSYTSISDTAPGYSSDDIADYNASCDDPFADDSASDPPLNPSAYTQPLPNIFATPGPGYRSPQQIYFDSPTEDPSDSDSLQPGYEIDYETLDFHWRPLNLKGSDATEHQETTQLIPLQHAGIELYVDIEPDQQEIFQATKQDQSHPLSSPRRVLSPSPFAFSVGSQSEAYPVASSHEPSTQQCQTTPEFQRHTPPAFAPAPGIFLSPLCDADLPNSVDGSPCKPTTPDRKTNLLGTLDKLYASPKQSPIKYRSHTLLDSQESNDSIESWQDVDI